MADSIDAIIKDITKKFGEGVIELLSETDDYDIRRISSGSLNLDLALGGGFPRGRTIEIYGPESGGKTTIALLHAVEVQREYPDRYILFVDLERTFSKEIAESYGVDSSRFIVASPTSGEEAFDIAEALIRSGKISLVILDSVSALLPTSEEKSSMEQQTVGTQARLVSKALRKMTPLCASYDCTFIYVNQIREKVGVMYGNPETTSGGRAIPFYSSVRLNVRAGDKITDPKTGERIGHVINARVVKNKTAFPDKVASFPLFYGIGVDKVAEVADIAVLLGTVAKAGAWLRIQDDSGKPVVRKWKNAEGQVIETILNFQGKDRFVEHLREDTELYKLLERVVYGDTVAIDEFKGNMGS